MHRRFHEDPGFKQKHIARVRSNDARYKKSRDDLIAEFRANGCLLCPERSACCLTAHHIDPEQKDFDVGNAGALKVSPTRLAKELVKCVCLCMNCHAKVHADELSLNFTQGAAA